MKKALALILVLVMLFGMMPMTAFATEKDHGRLSLEGLNVLCLGDSITAGQGLTTDTRWTNVLASKYSWNLTNKSQGGISLSSYYYTANGKSDVSIAKKAEILKTMTTKPDVIIVWGGHNDTSYRYSPLGTWDDETTDSFKGALKYIAELADEYAPDATLFLLTPLWTTEAPSTLKVPENTTDNNWMFVDAIYEGADIYGWIPVNMDLCGINPFTKSGLLLDNIHPNAAGTEKIVEYLSEELASYGVNSKKETIMFNKSAVSMKAGESTTLKGVLSPRSGTGITDFTWNSSNPSVATVDANGKITAVAHGNAIITAATSDGTSATVSVTVDNDDHTYENGICTGCGAALEGTVATGTCGENLTWTLDADGVLTISGTGPMDFFDIEEVGTPWFDYLEDIKKLIINDGVTSIGGYSFVGCSALAEVTIPNSVTIIDAGAFMGCTSLTKITIPDNVTTIGYGSFAGCTSLSKVNIPDGVTIIEGETFYDCTSLTEVTIPACVKEIGEGAFRGCENLTVVTFAGDAPEIGENAFLYVTATCYYPGSGKWTEEVMQNYGGTITWDYYGKISGTCGENLTWTLDADGVLTISGIGPMDFFDIEEVGTPWLAYLEDIKKLIINDGVTSIGGYSFMGCSALAEVMIPNSVTIIDVAAFMGCTSLTEITIHDSVTTIGYGAFADCTTLSKVNISAGVTIIEGETFYKCTSLTEMTIPASVKEIGEDAFSGCDNLTVVIFAGDAPVIAYDAFCYITATCYYPAGNDTWTEDKMQNYEGTITWVASGKPGPVVTQQPANAEAALGERYCVTVEAEGENLKYQWYFRNAGTAVWYKSSVCDNTYDDVMTTARAGREVYCVITDANGNSVTTDIAKLIRIPAEELEIVTQPTNGEAILGERYCVTVEAKGEGLKYQWYFRNAGTETWYTSSVRDNTYDDIMTTARAGREVYCVITDAFGNKVKTDVVTLIRVPVKLEITIQPTDAMAAFGEMFCAAVEAKGDGLKYQWYFRNAGTDTWYTSGVRDNTYDDIMTKARNGREVYCVITDQWGNSVTTDTVKLIAVPSVELKLLGVSYESAAMGENYCLTVNAQGEGLKYTWYFCNAGSDTWYRSGVTDNTYDDVMTKARANREVYCVITDAYGNQITTEGITLEVSQ